MRLHTSTHPLDEAQGLELLPQHGTNADKHQLVALVWAALYFMLCAVIQDSRNSYPYPPSTSEQSHTCHTRALKLPCTTPSFITSSLMVLKLCKHRLEAL